jgi:hypothetical protein
MESDNFTFLSYICIINSDQNILNLISNWQVLKSFKIDNLKDERNGLRIKIYYSGNNNKLLSLL